jgi:hypothetical protein
MARGGSRVEIPSDLRTRLETARLDLLPLFRALDRMNLTPAEIPRRLVRQLFEMDADFAEALWALDQPVTGSHRPPQAVPAAAYNMVPGRNPQTG